MVYAKRLGAFMPLVSLVTSIALTYFAKPALEKWSPGHWQVLVLCVGLLLFGGVFLLVYLLNLILIRTTSTDEFRENVKNRWRDILTGIHKPRSSSTDYVDRVAELQVRISTPALVREVVSELSRQRVAEVDSLRKTVDQFKSANNLRSFIGVLNTRWTSPVDFAPAQPRLIDDPIHGCVTLDSTLSTLIAQPIVQRLSRIRQLSFSYAHFPSATHSRLSHVLGVAHNVEAALNGIFARGVYYEEGAHEPTRFPDNILNRRDEIIRRAKVLAILHDLGHGPFGHALDNYVGYINRYKATPNPDKLFSRLYIERHLANTLNRLGLDANELMRSLNQESRDLLTGLDPLIADLIDSSMDMDRMDYLLRDAHMTGLSMGFTNASALIECVRPIKDGDAYLLAYDERGLDYMEHLLYAREAMYRSCYEHPRKRAAERVFERLIREVAGDNNPEIVEELYILTDEEVLSALRLVSLTDTAKRLLDYIVSDSEFEVIHEVSVKSRTISDEASAWVKSAMVDKKGKKCYVDQPATWEDAIARASIGVEHFSQIQVIVAPPSAYEQKFDGATILTKDESGAYKTSGFFEKTPRVKEVLSEMNPARSLIRVMCDSKLSAADRQNFQLLSSMIGGAGGEQSQHATTHRRFQLVRQHMGNGTEPTPVNSCTILLSTNSIL
jgi:HD superfamily phosphohydrolase